MSNTDTSKEKHPGFRIQSLLFWLTVIAGALLLVTVITMLRVSVRFNDLMIKNEIISDTNELTKWNLGDMTRFLKSQQKILVDLEAIFSHQQIYVIILVILLIVTFTVLALLVLRPIHRFEEALEEDKELPVIGSAEMRRFAEKYNTTIRNNAASKLVFQHEAEHDALTGLFNRGAFEKMKQYLKGSLEPLAILLIDVDLFKHVNDNYGHEVGDAALKKVAGMLTEKFRSSDLIFRIGGDEFCIIMQKITPTDKNVIREKLDAMNNDLAIVDDQVPAKLSISVGIAFSQFGFNEDLFAKTDKALYYTKEHGRKGYTFYNSKIESDTDK